MRNEVSVRFDTVSSPSKSWSDREARSEWKPEHDRLYYFRDREWNLALKSRSSSCRTMFVLPFASQNRFRAMNVTLAQQCGFCFRGVLIQLIPSSRTSTFDPLESNDPTTFPQGMLTPRHCQRNNKTFWYLGNVTTRIYLVKAATIVLVVHSVSFVYLCSRTITKRSRSNE